MWRSVYCCLHWSSGGLNSLWKEANTFKWENLTLKSGNEHFWWFTTRYWFNNCFCEKKKPTILLLKIKTGTKNHRFLYLENFFHLSLAEIETLFIQSWTNFNPFFASQIVPNWLHISLQRCGIMFWMIFVRFH